MSSISWEDASASSGYGARGNHMYYHSDGYYRWDGWGTYGDIRTGIFQDRSAFRANLNLTSGEKLTEITLTVSARMYGGWGSSNKQIDCFLYTSDPTDYVTPQDASHNYGYDPKPGYVASASCVRTQIGSSYTTFPAIKFTGLNIKTSGKLYFLFRVHKFDGNEGYLDIYAHSSVQSTSSLPTISGIFKGYTLSVSPSSVATGNNVSITIGGGSGESITARIKYGNMQLWSGTTTNGSLSVAVNKSWFTTAGITTANSMQVTVTIDQDTSKSATFTVTAGSNMKPTVGALSFVPVNSGRVATNFPNDYIAGYSKVKVSAAVTAGSNASISSVVLSFPGGTNVTMAYNSTSQKYEGTTAAVINGNVTFTVTATDARGLSGNNQGALSGVAAYVPPSISPDMDHCFRCDSSGVQQNGGTYATVKASATWYSALSGNALTQFLFYIKEDRTAGYSDSQNLTSDQQSTPLEMHVPGENDVVTIVIAIQDKVSEASTVEIRLPAALKNIYVRRTVDGTYLGVGMAPQRRSGKSDIELPDGGAVLIGGVPLQSVTNFSDDARDGSQFGKDFLAVNRSNPYDVKNTEVEFYQRSSETGWTNSPLGTSATLLGIRRVAILSSTRCAVTIQEFYPVAGRLWTNFYNNNAWSGWKSITPT